MMCAAGTPRSSSVVRIVSALAAAALIAVLAPASRAEAAAVTRLAGPERITTAVAVARSGWSSSPSVVVARADEPADALAGTPLAAALDAPLLLSARDRLPSTTAEEIRRLGAREAVVLGGAAALSDGVLADLRRLGLDVRRVAGANRYATAAAVASELGAGPGDVAYVVGSWQEALAVSGLAARRTGGGEPTPILLAGADLPTETAVALRSSGIRSVVVVGSSVGTQARAALAAVAAVSTLGNADTYTTSLAAARTEAPSDAVVLATGRDFPDGLSAGALAARRDAVLLLTPTDRVLDAQLTFVRGLDAATAFVAGGPAAVSETVVTAIRAALAPVAAAPVDGDTPENDGTEPVATPPSVSLPTIPAGAVSVAPGQSIQAAVDASPAGTTFVLKSGVHREQSVVPKHGDTFIGERGTVLSGARLLPASAWRPSGGNWVIGGQTAQGFVHGTVVADGNPRDRHPEELFADGRRLLHVGSLAELGPGRWHFDYAGDRVHLGQDPAALGALELSTTVGAFGGTAVRGVTIANLTIERYATPAQHGAIGFFGRHWTYDWTVLNTTVRQNHGAGIRIGPGMTVAGSRVLDNGQIGIAGDGADRSSGEPGYSRVVTIRDTEIARNGQLTFDWQWEAGATKLKYTIGGSRFERNWVHHNLGPGPWWDIDNRDAVIVDNLVEENTVKGIFYEISHGRTLMARNIVRNNGRAVQPRVEGSGIFISNSEGVEVRGNVLYGNPYGVMLRSSANRSPAVSGVVVEGNDIAVTEGWSGLNVDHGAPTSLYGLSRFDRNTHRIPRADHRAFFWGDDSTHTFGEFQRMGQEGAGRVLVTTTPGPLPAVAAGLPTGTYGAR